MKILKSLNLCLLVSMTILFSGCGGSSDTITSDLQPTDDNVVYDFIMSFWTNTLTIQAGLADTVTVSVEIFADEPLGLSFKVEISESNPYGFSIDGCGHTIMYTGGNTANPQNTGSCLQTVFVPEGIPPGTYSLNLLATAHLTDGRTSIDDQLLYIVVPEPLVSNFEITCISSSLGLVQDRDIVQTININRLNGHAEPIDLSMANLPNGITYTFEPPTVTVNDPSSILTVFAGPNTAPNTYPATRIVGTDGTIENILNLPIIVIEEFTIAADPTAITISKGSSADVSINISKIAGFNESIIFLVDHAIVGQGDALVDTVFTPNPVPWEASYCTLNLSVGSLVPANTYSLQIKGIKGAMTKTTMVDLTVVE